jgi:hypothetical protein
MREGELAWEQAIVTELMSVELPDTRPLRSK